MENLDHYEGQVLNGLLHGKGKLTKANGIIAEGSFVNGHPEGEITVSLPNKQKYILQIKDGLVIKETLLSGNNNRTKPAGTSPYQPKPGSKSKPKGGIFLFAGLGLDKK